jgi:hypothetical protein
MRGQAICSQTHRVVKATLGGEILDEWLWPHQTGKYGAEAEHKPLWTLHRPDGGFFVLDGYGRDFITHYNSAGKFVRIFGGAEGSIGHWGPHGGMVDGESARDATLLIAMSDQQHLLRLSQTGEKLGSVDLPGGNPRQIRRHGGHYFVAHLGDNWPKDRNCRGFVSVLDSDLRVVSNIGGTAPEYGPDGALRTMRHSSDTFMHPHDLVVDKDDSIYVGSIRNFVCGSGLLGFTFWNQRAESKNLEPNWMANWLIAALHVVGGFFHFRVMFCKAR